MSPWQRRRRCRYSLGEPGEPRLTAPPHPVFRAKIVGERKGSLGSPRFPFLAPETDYVTRSQYEEARDGATQEGRPEEGSRT